MKLINRRMVAFGIILAVCCSAYVVHSQKRPTTGKKTDAKFLQTSPVDAAPEVDAYGALRGLKNNKGENFFGKDTPMPYDGYSIAYRIGKASEQSLPVIISAVKDRVTMDQLVPIKGNGSEGVAVKTQDNALQITSQFKVNPQRGILAVAREIKDVSTQPVSLLAFEIHTDARFSRYFKSDQRRLSTGIKYDPFSAYLITPLSVPPPCRICDPCGTEPCPEYCPPCPNAPARPDSCAEYAEGASSSTIFSIGRCGTTCLLKPEFCNTFYRRMVSSWSVSNRFPVTLSPGEVILVRMSYHLR